MKKLTKKQWIAFGVTAFGIILGYIAENGSAFGIGGNVLSLIGLLRLLWEQYNSFSASDVASFANEFRLNPSVRKGILSSKDVKVWAKHVGTRPKDPPNGGGDEVGDGNG